MGIIYKLVLLLACFVIYSTNTITHRESRSGDVVAKPYNSDTTSKVVTQTHRIPHAYNVRNSTEQSQVPIDMSDRRTISSNAQKHVNEHNSLHLQKTSITMKTISNRKVYCSSVMKCVCTLLQEGNFRADCSNLGLTSIPHFESDVTEINLNDNAIREFPNVSTFPKNLIVLSLSKNMLAAFGNNPFEGLIGLKELDLSGNKLEYHPTIYNAQLFKDLIHLEWLNLRENNDKNHDSYPKGIPQMRNLKTLYLDGMEGASFPESYKNLSLLSSLFLGGTNRKICTVENINADMFQNLLPIKHLDLSFCSLRSFEKESLRQLPSIQSLDLSNNILLTFNALSNISFGLPFTNIRSLILDKIHCKDGVGTAIFEDDVKYLSNTSLTKLSLKENRLELVDSTVIDLLPKTLKYIDISQNRIKSLYLLLSLIRMPSIQTINLNQQPKYKNSGLDPSDLVNCQDWRGPQSNSYGISTSRKSSSPPLDNYDDIDIIVSPTLQNLYANDLQSRSGFMVKLRFSQPNNLSTIHLSNGGLDSWMGGFRNLHNLTFLDISDNVCNIMSGTFFSDLPSLKFLNIRNNVMGKLLSQDQETNYFDKLNNLEHFDMSNIGLTNLPPNIFQGLSNLKILNVSSNSLSDWSANIHHMTRLSYLDLGANKIRSLNSVTMDAIDTIASNSSMKIDLTDNSLLCTCDTLSFLKWMNKKHTLFINFDSYACIYNNDVVKFKNFADILSSLEKNCARYSEVTTAAVIVIGLVVMLIVCGILYRYRWRIRYLYQMARTNYKPLQQTDNCKYEYDAFMSYAEEDTYFVVGETLPVLEDQFGLKLSVHQRDFIAGNSIAANITANIHKSRKTIAIISTNFLQSYWCMFEFNMARMESIYSRGGEPTILLILLENLKPRDLPLTMLDIIDTDSYLRVPTEKNEEFWENFRRAVLMN